MARIRFYRLASLLGAFIIMTVACTTVEAKKPALRNSVWVCEREMFVADVGTMEETYTLKFLPGKKCIFESRWYTPAHPAMYVNEDGSIDTHPASSSESTYNGTWRYRLGILTVTLEDDREYVFVFQNDALVTDEFYGLQGTFVKQ